MPKRRRKGQQSKRSAERPGGRPLVDAWGGWVVSGDGRTVVGSCACGEAAVADCPECGPQCQRCFLGGG